MLRSGNIYNPVLFTNIEHQKKTPNVESLEKMSFDKWKQLIENIIFAKLNMHCNDLPDEDYWVNWNNGITPHYMANIILKSIDDMEEEMMIILQDHARFYLNQ
jgi:hypothetical protein